MSKQPSETTIVIVAFLVIGLVILMALSWDSAQSINWTEFFNIKTYPK